MDKSVRVYTEKLEKVIDIGVELRHQMRIKNENKDVIIRAQGERIKQLEQQVESLKVVKGEKQMVIRQQREQLILPKFEGLKVRYENQEAYCVRLKQYIRDHNDGQLPEELKK